jgi:hypothetical protein
MISILTSNGVSTYKLPKPLVPKIIGGVFEIT